MKYKTWLEYPELKDSDGKPHYRPMYLYLLAKREYYRGKPVMSDQVFDVFEEDIKKSFPDCPSLEVVGEPSQDDFVELGDWVFNKREF